jgi:hypothetical protein
MTAELDLGGCQLLARAHVKAVVGEIRDLGREYPIVALTARPGEHCPAMPAPGVRAIVGADAALYFVPTPALVHKLDVLLGPRLRLAPGGAARLWWPGAVRGSDPADHPSIFDPDGVYGEPMLAVLAERFAATRPVTRQRVSFLERQLDESREQARRLEMELGQAVLRARAAETALFERDSS